MCGRNPTLTPRLWRGEHPHRFSGARRRRLAGALQLKREEEKADTLRYRLVTNPVALLFTIRNYWNTPVYSYGYSYFNFLGQIPSRFVYTWPF